MTSARLAEIRRKAKTSMQCSIFSTFKIIQKHQNKCSSSNAIFLWTLKHTKLNLAGTPRFVNILKIIIFDLQKTLHIQMKHLETKL